MPSALVIPGVQVRTEFEPAPVLPGATGILGVVGVVDRGPTPPTPIGSLAELVDLFGPASRYSMPEVRTAFSNGVFQAVIARIEPGRGQKAALDLLDDEGEVVVRLEARAEGSWANRLAARISQVRAISGQGIKYVNVEMLLGGQVIETFSNLVMDHSSPDFLFSRLNEQSRVVVAVDPLFEKALPVTLPRTDLADAEPRAATAVLRAAADDVLRVEAKRTGRGGNQTAIRVTDGSAGLLLVGAGDVPSLEVLARAPGAAGTDLRVSVQPASASAVTLTVIPTAGSPRPYGPFATPEEIVAALAADPDVVAAARSSTLPVSLPSTRLSRRVTLEVVAEGRDTGVYRSLPTLAAVAAISDPVVRFEAVGAATALPDASPGVPLTGGRPRGLALQLLGDTSDEPIVELVAAPAASGPIAVSVTRAVSTLDNATAVVSLSVFSGDELTESYGNLTMDPDDPNYLPRALGESSAIRAFDLFVRSRSTSFPRALRRPAALSGGTSPSVDDYQAALDRLESAEEVDLVIASVNHQLDAAGVRAVHQAVAAHCARMAEMARNRIGIGSVAPAETGSPADILDHADDVRSDHFALVAPSGLDAAVAGLLGRQLFFDSPTFKNITSPDGEPGHYTDSQLTQLINGNVLVVNERRRLGVIVTKGLLTSGRQVNVQRTANKAVREVKAIADRYIGLLNTEGGRNALKQQITAMFLQMQRDGAIVPSTDGKDPAYKVDVYSTQADFANGIVRVDIAIRPVRAIDFIYATILVKN